jgi:colanic acid/amylovoran biosynthesis glycosyltransferase
MSESDIFVLPGIDDNGRSENQGLVIQEAQAMELPVLVSNVGGMPEGLIDGESGFVVAEYDLEGFVQKIIWLSENADRRNSMGKAGRNFVQGKYDMVILTKKLIKIYNEPQ